MRVPTLMVLAISLHSPALLAEEVQEMPMAPQPALECEEAITVFQDVSAMGRKKKAANNMTKRHAEMAQSGWRFASMAVYTENGDLEGFYISYTRATACPGKPAG